MCLNKMRISLINYDLQMTQLVQNKIKNAKSLVLTGHISNDIISLLISLPFIL